MLIVKAITPRQHKLFKNIDIYFHVLTNPIHKFLLHQYVRYIRQLIYQLIFFTLTVSLV